MHCHQTSFWRKLFRKYFFQLQTNVIPGQPTPTLQHSKPDSSNSLIKFSTEIFVSENKNILLGKLKIAKKDI